MDYVAEGRGRASARTKSIWWLKVFRVLKARSFYSTYPRRYNIGGNLSAEANR